jgi:Holliday junction DNA helicase RuvA
MICKIQGVLETIVDSRARIDIPGGLTYELLLSAYAAARLGGDLGKPVTLHTIYYLEGSSQGGNMTPRLVGFLDETDRRFFELFTSVKGIGPKKALRAMTMSSAQIAAAIADRDVKTLQSLPEVGRRTAETIVAELHGKVDKFLTAPASSSAAGAAAPVPTRSAAREALEVLLQLGENRVLALQWVDEVMQRQPDLTDAQAIITQVLRLKTGK